MFSKVAVYLNAQLIQPDNDMVLSFMGMYRANISSAHSSIS
jgi:hypothetical protein